MHESCFKKALNRKKIKRILAFALETAKPRVFGCKHFKARKAFQKGRIF